VQFLGWHEPRTRASGRNIQLEEHEDDIAIHVAQQFSDRAGAVRLEAVDAGAEALPRVVGRAPA